MFRHRLKAQAFIEFGIATFFALLLFLGTLQFGLYIYGLSVAENAAREGARWGAVAQQNPVGLARAKAYQAAQDTILRDVSVSVSAGPLGSVVTVTVSGRIPSVFPAGDMLGLDDLLHVQARAQFRKEGW